jgi:hypothetical protein
MNAMMPSYMPMQDLTRPQDVSGVQPMYQNTGNQQVMQQQMLQGLGNSAQMLGQRPQGGMNPMAMAMLLRKGGSNPYMNAQRAMQQYGANNVYGYGGMGQVPTMTTGMD